MRIRVLVAAVAMALTAVPLAWSSGTASTKCGTVRGGGVKWSVVAAHVSCSTAKPLVVKLAAKPHPTLATRLGTHRGLRCIEYSHGRQREIACISVDGRRSVYGVSPPHK